MDGARCRGGRVPAPDTRSQPSLPAPLRPEQGRRAGAAGLAGPRESAHHLAPGHPSTGIPGNWEERSLPCCSAAPAMLLGGSRLPTSRRGWYPPMPKHGGGTTPALATGPGHTWPLRQKEVSCGSPMGWHQGWAPVLCYRCCGGQEQGLGSLCQAGHSTDARGRNRGWGHLFGVQGNGKGDAMGCHIPHGNSPLWCPPRRHHTAQHSLHTHQLPENRALLY